MAAKLKIGILGVGPIAQIAHLPALKRAENVELIALCDASEDLGHKIAKKYDVPAVYSDHHKFLAESGVDAVLIAVAHAFHAPLSIDAMRAGKHVLVEKPLAVTVEECEDVVRVAKETGRQCQMACMKRWDPALQFAQKYVREEMGDRLMVSGWYCDSVFHMNYVNSRHGKFVTGTGQKRPGAPAKPMDGHINNLLGHGVHLLDTLRFFGGDIVAVTTTKTDKQKKLVTLSLLEFADGARGTFSLVVNTRMDWFEGLHIHGMNGSVLAQLFFPYMFRPADVRVMDGARGEYRTPATPDCDQYERQIEGFASALLEGRPVSPNAADGLKAQKVLYAMYESAEKGTRIEVV